VSTAADQVKLLREAMRISAFAEVVSMQSYTPPHNGAVRPAGNSLLGRDGVIGGKTGFTDAAGGNYVFAAERRRAPPACSSLGR
jgi:D-alanyl-D-alanine carboxypeptidase